MKKIGIYYKNHLNYALGLMAKLTKELEAVSAIEKVSVWGMGYTSFKNGDFIQVLPINATSITADKLRYYTEIYVEEGLAEDELAYWLSLTSGKENFSVHRFNS